MKKLMYISSCVNSNVKNARTAFAKSYFNLLTEILGEDNCILYSVVSNSRTRWGKVKNIVYENRYGGMSIEEETNILQVIKRKKIENVLIDTTAWGYLAERIKKNTNCICYVYLQDVEYFRCKTIRKDLLKSRNYKAYLQYKLQQFMAEKNEKKAVYYSDYLITYTDRDAKLLWMKYKKRTDLVTPLFIEDKPVTEMFIESPYKNTSKSILFVSALNYEPNLTGIRWFVKNVFPFIRGYHLYIVGSGSESFRDEFESDGIHVVGRVEDLTSYYHNADIVIIPLFCGGGMKYKTVEAMSFGKTIVGTKEAFTGYEINFSRAGGLCNTAEEWIKCLGTIKSNKYNSYSRQVFLKKYSKDVIKKRCQVFFCTK